MPLGLLAGLPAEHLEAFLLHELAHIRRRDYLVNVLERLAEGLLFYHPAVWWISRVIRSERENCCDDVVVSIQGRAPEYAAALVSLEQKRCSFRQPAVAASGGNLVTRVHRLLHPEISHAPWTPFVGAFVLIATAAVAMAAWAPPQSAAKSSPGAQMDPRYSRWPSEDVVYIIDDDERAAFLKLTTDAERDRFIEQFWAERNPAPGGAENVYKQEHYRRIAYANSHFGTDSGAPGWQTDRGHIYIVWGPPDEIETHPGTPRNPLRTEVWAYRRVQGIGEKGTVTFIDRTGHGDYRLAPGNARF
jgi:GWxTD domain-containing protein